MSHLVEVYAKDLGVKIGKPYFQPHYFPIIEDKYITIHTDDKVESKHYDYWEEVIIIVKSVFKKVKFIQIGSGKEPKIKNVDSFIKTNSIKQSAYIIDKALLHVGIDSSPVHIASHLDKPIVAIYGHTYSKTCDPLWGSKANHCIIESHRDGKKPSFSLKENPKTINFIKPEEIANSILKKLDRKKSSRETLYLGKEYKNQGNHVIPDEKYDISNKTLSIRLDLLNKEENILHLCTKNKLSLIIKEPVSDLLLNQVNISSIFYISDSFDANFIEKVKSLGITINLLCTDKEKISEQRYVFFDYRIFLLDEEEKINKNKKKLTLEEKDFSLKSYSLFYKNGEVYSSLYEANGKENLDDIFLDLETLMIYTESNE